MRQDEIKVGMRVRVKKTVRIKNPKGWDNSWVSPDMDKTMGEIGRVVAIKDWDNVVQFKQFNDYEWGYHNTHLAKP